MVDADGHEGETPKINGPPVVVDNVNPDGSHTYTVTQIVQTQVEQQITLGNGQPGTATTTTTTTYKATFDMGNQVVDGTASKQSTYSTQTYDSSGNRAGEPSKPIYGPNQSLSNNDIANGLNQRDEKAFCEHASRRGALVERACHAGLKGGS